MISFIPELDIMKAVVDSNIDSPSAKCREDAFEELNILLAKTQSVEIMEGILYDKLKVRLTKAHQNVFEHLYIIDNSALDVENYNITKAIKFIAINKAKLPKRKVVIVTDSLHKYSGWGYNSDIVIYTPEQIIKRSHLFHKIVSSYDSNYGALLTAFFTMPDV